jgi:DNA repair protein RadC
VVLKASVPLYVKGRKTMTLNSFFVDEKGKQTKSIRMKVIRPVWEKLTIHEVPANYISGRTRVTSSREVFDLFRFLANETKEHFLALHMDSKNRILCLDHVSSGSLNASIVHPREVFCTSSNPLALSSCKVKRHFPEVSVA